MERHYRFTGSTIIEPLYHESHHYQYRTMKMNNATQHRLQAYLTGLATTTGLVASSGATIVTINIADTGLAGANAGLSPGYHQHHSIPGLPSLILTTNYAYSSMSMFITGINASSNNGKSAGIAFTDPSNPEGYATPKNFAYDQTIGSTSNFFGWGWAAFGAFQYNWAAEGLHTSAAFGADSYLGFTDGENHYGWLEVTWDPTQGVNGTFEILAGAYESEAGKPIAAGQLTAIPEPGNLLALSGLVSSALFLRTRRGKRAAA